MKNFQTALEKLQGLGGDPERESLLLAIPELRDIPEGMRAEFAAQALQHLGEGHSEDFPVQLHLTLVNRPVKPQTVAEWEEAILEAVNHGMPEKMIRSLAKDATTSLGEHELAEFLTRIERIESISSIAQQMRELVAAMAGGVETGRWEEVILEIPEGLHNRPSNSFSRCAARFGGEVLVRRGSDEANGASILGLMMLAADNGEKLQLWIERKPEWEKTRSDLIAILKGDQGVTNYWSNR